jgi:5-methylcytosine-specific restriction enzyme A
VGRRIHASTAASLQSSWKTAEGPNAEPQRAAVVSAQIYRRAAWRRLRKRVLQQQPFCQKCFERGDLTPAQALHHVISVEKDPTRAFDVTNLMPLCTSCHSCTEQELTRGYSLEFGVDGFPVDKRHPVWRNARTKRS